MSILKKRDWWTTADLVNDLPMKKDLVRKLVINGAFGKPFQPGGPGGKLFFVGAEVEAFVADNRERTARELDLPS